jgi:serine/threonine-protein kinase HipA
VDQEFKIVDQFGTYIIKPQNDLFPQLPENEDVTMQNGKSVWFRSHFTDAIW